MRLIPCLVALLVPLAAQATPLLPDTLLKSIKADPASYLERVSILIASYGSGDGITEEEVAASMALVRAKARVAAVLPLMGADLDADGTVTREESAVAEASVSAAARARIEKAFLKADGNGDATVSAEELADLGAEAAMAAYSPAEMAGIKVLMGFDADADGRVTLAEVREGLVGLVS